MDTARSVPTPPTLCAYCVLTMGQLLGLGANDKGGMLRRTQPDVMGSTP